MDQSALIEPTAAYFDQLVWHVAADQLRAVRSAIAALLTALHLEVDALLAEWSDESLALAFQQDFYGREAFEELFVRRYTPILTHWLFRWRTDPEVASDLLQDLFLKCFRNRLARFEPTRSFRNYLWKIVRHAWVERTGRARKVDALDDPASLAGREPDPVDEAAGRELQQRFDVAREQLPPDQRAVLDLAMRGCDAATIAAAITQPIRVVYRLLFRARRAIERALGQPPPS